MSTNQITPTTTKNLFSSILKYKKFYIQGRLFEYQKVFKKNDDTLVCKCISENKYSQDGVEYVVKVIKLGEALYNDASDTSSGCYQFGELKYSQIIDKFYSSLVVTYEIAILNDDEIILVSEFRGMTLQNYGMDKNGKLLLIEVLQIFLNLVNALLLTSQNNIIHRDINPRNIFCNYKTHKTLNRNIDLILVALGDFGIATKDTHQTNTERNDKQYEPTRLIDMSSITTTSSTTLNGTPGYIAPECANGEYSIKSDIWSLARTIIWLLFLRTNNSNMEVKYLEMYCEKIINLDLNDDIIYKLIEEGNLETDIKGWKYFFNIIRDMLNNRIEPKQILQYLFKCEISNRPIMLKQNYEFISTVFVNNVCIQLYYIIEGIHFSTLVNVDKSLAKDREFILEAVKKNSVALSYVDNSLTNDREIVLQALEKKADALKYANETFKKDRELVLELVKKDGYVLQYVDESLKKDKEIVLEAVKQHNYAFQFADESLKKNREIILEAIKHYPFAIESLKGDREIVLQAAIYNALALKYADESFKKDREFMLSIVKRNGYALEFANESLKKDRELVLEAVKQNGLTLQNANELFKKDREIVLEAVKQNGYALEYVAKLLKQDREIVIEAVKQNGYVLEYADESLKKDREILLAVNQNTRSSDDLQKDKDTLASTNFTQNASPVKSLPSSYTYMQKDREFMLAAVKNNGYALSYAHQSLKQDREILLAALTKNGMALEFVDESLKKDREVVLKAVTHNGYALRYADESLKKDREFVLKAINQHADALRYVDESFKKDKDIVFEAVKRNGSTLRYVDELKQDREIVLEAVRKDGYALEYADESLKKDREIVLEAVRQKGYALKYVDELLKKDREIVLEAVRQNGYVLLEYVDESLKNDTEIVLEAQASVEKFKMKTKD